MGRGRGGRRQRSSQSWADSMLSCASFLIAGSNRILSGWNHGKEKPLKGFGVLWRREPWKLLANNVQRHVVTSAHNSRIACLGNVPSAGGL